MAEAHGGSEAEFGGKCVLPGIEIRICINILVQECKTCLTRRLILIAFYEQLEMLLNIRSGFSNISQK